MALLQRHSGRSRCSLQRKAYVLSFLNRQNSQSGSRHVDRYECSVKQLLSGLSYRGEHGSADYNRAKNLPADLQHAWSPALRCSQNSAKVQITGYDDVAVFGSPFQQLTIRRITQTDLRPVDCFPTASAMN